MAQIPGIMCTTTPFLLLFEDISKSPREVHWLDLIGSYAKPAAGKRVVRTKPSGIFDMCFVQDGGKQLLVVTCGGNGIFTYNTDTDKLEWKVDVKLPGIEKDMDFMVLTNDGRGHLFVGDYVNGNKCIQMFSATDGQYLGCLMKDIEKFGDPCGFRCCEKTSSLLTAHFFKKKWNLNVITIWHTSAEGN